MNKRRTKIGLVSLVLVASSLSSMALGPVQKVGALDGRGQVSVPLSFWAQDTDGDGLFNYLWVNVTFDVFVQDVFEFTLDLDDQTNTTDVVASTHVTYLKPGTHVVPLRAIGFGITTSSVDGPYSADVLIVNGVYQYVAWPSGISPAYLATQFEEPPGYVGLPFNDQGYDLDSPPDILFNRLSIQVPVTINESYDYFVIGLLMPLTPGPPIAIRIMTVGKSIGTTVYNFTLSGLAISGSGIDGPYAFMAILGAYIDGEMVWAGMSMLITQPYLAAMFQTRFPVPVTGTVLDYAGQPLPNANVVFTNYIDLNQVQTSSDLLGQYAASLYIGTWMAVVSDSAGGHLDYVTNIRVTGMGDVFDFGLTSTPPARMNVTMTMASPDSGQLDMVGLRYSGVATYRLIVDTMFGDWDGTVSQSESDFFVPAMGGASMVDDTDDMAFLDDIFYYPDTYASNTFSFDLVGDIASTTVPVVMAQQFHVASNSTIPVKPTHLLRLNTTYDPPFQESRTTIVLPPGWTATSYDPVTNVTVSGIGTGTVNIEPMGNPNPGGIPDFVWVNITISGDPALIPPSVEGQSAVPDPQEWQLPVLISAWVNDTTPIARVDVEVRAPLGGLVGNFSMSPNLITGKYEYTLAGYADLGMYSYTIWAIDTDNNVGQGTGTFLIRDTTVPFADAGVDITIVNGSAANFDGTASTDNFALDNWTWTFNDGFGPVTLYGSTPSHVFNLEGTYLVTLTVRDTSGNPDTDTMNVNVLPVGALIIEGQAAHPDPQEFIAPILIDAWVNSSNSLTSVDVEILRPGGVLLGNYSMTQNLISGKYEYTLSTYADLGTYTFTIWAIDSLGAIARGDGTFVVQDTTNPTANAGSDQNVVNGTVVTLDGSGSTDNFRVDNWTWTFNDGVGSVTLYGNVQTHTFTVPGTYTVTLAVRDTMGNPGSDTMIVTVTWPPKPRPPATVQAQQTALTQNRVTWAAPTQNTDGSAIVGPLTYAVYRATVEAGPYTLVTSGLTQLQYDDAVPSTGTYYYKVDAKNQWANTSDQSSPAMVAMTNKGGTYGSVQSGGQPLQGALVQIIDSTGTVLANYTTTANGTFTFGGLSPGTYTVRASKDGYNPDEKSVTISPLAYADAGVLTLTVKEAAGELPWLWIILAIVALLVIIGLVAFMRKKKAKPEIPSPEELKKPQAPPPEGQQPQTEQQPGPPPD